MSVYHRASPLTDRVRGLVCRPGGLATGEVSDLSPRQVGRAVERLQKLGQAHGARTASSSAMRYFGTAAEANAYAAEQARAPRQPSTPSKDAFIDKPNAGRYGIGTKTGDHTRRAPWPADTEPHYPVDAAGVPTWRFTRCPPTMAGGRYTNTYGEDA
jgi:hypothetical protein